MELNSPNIITLNRDGKYAVSLIRTDPSVILKGEGWSVDWYDVKQPFLHRWHLFAKRRLLAKNQGQTVIQLSLDKVVIPNLEVERNFLILTRYMNIEAILKLYSSTIHRNILDIQSGSVHRCFGLIKKLDDGTLSSDVDFSMGNQLIYMVHVFKESDLKWTADFLKDLATRFDVFTDFIGRRSGLLGITHGSDRMNTLDFDLNGVLIFSAFETSQFSEMIDSDEYVGFMKIHTDHFVGLYKRG